MVEIEGRDLKKQERAAIEAVARRFSAAWEKSSDAPDAYLLVGGKRVAVGLTTLKTRGARKGNAGKPRLRFDKVAIRLTERLQATLGKTVPHGMTVVLTITAPIRMASKTAASLEDRIRTALRRRSRGRDGRATIHGNLVQIRFLRSTSERAPRMIGFVHNPDSDPALLVNMTREVLDLVSAETGTRVSRLGGDRWRIVMSARGSACLEAYRYIYSQLRKSAAARKTLMVFGDGRVETLTG